MSTLRIVEYSDRSIAVYGDTKEYKDKLKELGGKFNSNLREGAGWIFPKMKESAVREFVRTGAVSTPVRAVVAPKPVPQAPKKADKTLEHDIMSHIKTLDFQQRVAFMAKISTMCAELRYIKGRKLSFDDEDIQDCDDDIQEDDIQEDDIHDLPRPRLLK
jgi:hypothetical protein